MDEIVINVKCDYAVTNILFALKNKSSIIVYKSREKFSA